MMEDADWQQYATRFKAAPALIPLHASKRPGIVICIPVYNEPDILLTLDSLIACELPDTHIEVMLLFNTDVRMTTEERMLHEFSWRIVNEWIRSNSKPGLDFLAIRIDWHNEKGGVGKARKQVMDEAARRMGPDGILLCLDADCTVDSNYLIAVDSFFKSHPHYQAASIFFEHPFDDLPYRERQAIQAYELHLRYLVEAQRWCGHPFAFHTVGSSMAIRRSGYLQQGGMNVREAGEDFYLLQKFIEIDALGEINTTTVYPSPRTSNKVPFGTGRAMQEILTEGKEWSTIAFPIFQWIKPLFNNVNRLHEKLATEDLFDLDGFWTALQGDPRALPYFHEIQLAEKVEEISRHTRTAQAFCKRFFRFFNAFRMIRYTNTMRDNHFPNTTVLQAVHDLFVVNQWDYPPAADTAWFLHHLRDRQRQMVISPGLEEGA